MANHHHHGHERPLRLLEQPAQSLQLGQHEVASGALGEQTGCGVDRRVGAMRGAERVVYV